jgi:TatA/E family protein of Tat protein translocase
MGPVGVQEMVVIFLVALVLFGPKKLPELAKTIGKAVSEFRRAKSELKATLDQHMSELERENESLREVTRNYQNEIMRHYDSPALEPYNSHSDNSNPYEHSSLVSNPTTEGATATQVAESTVPHEIAAPGTVPRSSQAGYPGDSAAAPEPNSVSS